MKVVLLYHLSGLENHISKTTKRNTVQQAYNNLLCGWLESLLYPWICYKCVHNYLLGDSAQSDNY